MPMRHHGDLLKVSGASVPGSRAGASHPAAVHAGDAAHEKASAKATHGLSQPESRHDSSDVGSGDDQDGTDGGDDETKRCVNGFCSCVARDLPRKHVATGVARGTRRAGRPHIATREIFFTTTRAR